MADFCRVVDESRSLISQYESGKTKPGLEILIKMASALEVPIDVLVYGENSEKLTLVGETPINFGNKAFESAYENAQLWKDKYLEEKARRELIEKEILALKKVKQ